MAFYFVFHPWSGLIRDDFKKTLESWRSQNISVPDWTICSGAEWLRCNIRCCNCCDVKNQKNNRSGYNYNVDRSEQGEDIALVDKSDTSIIIPLSENLHNASER